MAILEIELAPEEQTHIREEAARARLSVQDWVRHQILPRPAFITDDGEVFEIPDLPEDLGRACTLASEGALKKLWDTPQEGDAWPNTKTRPNIKTRRNTKTRQNTKRLRV